MFQFGGGYEILPVVGGCPAQDTAGRLADATLSNLKLPKKSKIAGAHPRTRGNH